MIIFYILGSMLPLDINVGSMLILIEWAMMIIVRAMVLLLKCRKHVDIVRVGNNTVDVGETFSVCKANKMIIG